jgi:hypothetical protein
VPVPLSVDVMAPVVLTLAPAVGAATLTVKVQLEAAAKLPLAKLTLFEPATAVAVPPQVLASPGTAATTRSPGSVSVKPIPLKLVAPLGLAIVYTINLRSTFFRTC